MAAAPQREVKARESRNLGGLVLEVTRKSDPRQAPLKRGNAERIRLEEGGQEKERVIRIV